MTLPDLLAIIPAPAERRLALRVTPAAQHALRTGHPWVFDQAITEQKGTGAPGDLAVIFDDRRKFLAIGLWDPTSPLRVRVLQHREPTSIDEAWLRDRLEAATTLRRTLPAAGVTGYRLVHGENDGLPGLVVDRYDATLVLKLYTVAWIPRLRALLTVLAAVAPAANVVLRLSREVASQDAHLFGLADARVLAGEVAGGIAPFLENGLRFEADVLRGQKTGFFLDQRDNRAQVGRLAAGKRVLNVFAYSGGFSVYAAAGGAPEVVSLDVSEPALAAAERHLALNADRPAVRAARHTILVADAFDALGELHRQKRRFDLVVVDPPSFAKRESEVSVALQAYARLTGLALGVLAKGGLLVQASCSSRVSADAFVETVQRAAARAGRPLRAVTRTGHALDHPIGFPAGAYLKCLYATA